MAYKDLRDAIDKANEIEKFKEAMIHNYFLNVKYIARSARDSYDKREKSNNNYNISEADKQKLTEYFNNQKKEAKNKIEGVYNMLLPSVNLDSNLSKEIKQKTYDIFNEIFSEGTKKMKYDYVKDIVIIKADGRELLLKDFKGYINYQDFEGIEAKVINYLRARESELKSSSGFENVCDYCCDSEKTDEDDNYVDDEVYCICYTLDILNEDDEFRDDWNAIVKDIDYTVTQERLRIYICENCNSWEIDHDC